MCQNHLLLHKDHLDPYQGAPKIATPGGGPTTTTGSGSQKEERLKAAPWGRIPDPQKEERLKAASWSSGRDAHVEPNAGTSARRVDFLRDLAFGPSQKVKFFAGALRAPAWVYHGFRQASWPRGLSPDLV